VLEHALVHDIARILVVQRIVRVHVPVLVHVFVQALVLVRLPVRVQRCSARTWILRRVVWWLPSNSMRLLSQRCMQVPLQR
jgi:hypothetical protein